MAIDYREVSDESINNANVINDRLIEKSLAMRCSSYLSQIKAQLLTDTIYEIDNSKKVLFNTNSKLEKEIAERKKAEEGLRKAKIEAEDATRLKDKFVTLVSHDLKNPLNAIMGYYELLRLSKDLPDNASTLVAKGLSACNDMNVLINEILNLSRIKAGKITPERTRLDAKKVAGLVIEQYSEAANIKEVSLINEVPENTSFFADEKLLIEVIGNLLSNSIKFCNQGDSVKIYLPEGESTVIAISDTGVGIKPELYDGLFEYENKTSTKGTLGEAGTGFGLPLARDIIESHGGDLRMESTLGEGTTFFISLPDAS